MSKLNRLTKYLKLADAADYLAEKIDEPVTEANLIEMALKGNVKVSVYIKDYCYAVIGTANVVPPKYKILGGNVDFDENSTLVSREFWDLAMIGQEIEFLEYKYELACEKPYENERVRDCEQFFLLTNGKWFICLLQEYDKNPLIPGSKVNALDRINSISAGKKDVADIDREQLAAKHEADRQEFLDTVFHIEEKGKILVMQEWLPDSTSLQIKISRLDKLADVLNQVEETPPTTPLGSKERNTLLVLLAILCKEAKFDYEARGISKAIEAATEEMGVRISDDTIRKVLKQIPEALESRKK
jgi:hypothetical protein